MIFDNILEHLAMLLEQVMLALIDTTGQATLPIKIIGILVVPG